MTKKKTSFEEVEEFHKAFNQPLVDGPPSLEAIEDRISLRMGLIAEEFEELVEAVYGPTSAKLFSEIWPKMQAADEQVRDLVECVDALGDLTYVINGFAVEARVNLDEITTHIHESNMSKLGADGKPIMSDGVTPDPRDGKIKPKGKILKGPNFWEPNIAKLLENDSTN